MTLTCPSTSSIVATVSVTKDILTTLAVVLAGVWFFARWQIGRRAVISLDCSFFKTKAGGDVIAEVALRLKNVGDVKQDLFGFELAITSIDDSAGIAPERNHLVEFSRIIVPEALHPVPDGDLRPGVERFYTFPFVLRNPGSLIQVSAAIRFAENKPAINKVLKIFSTISPDESRRK